MKLKPSAILFDMDGVLVDSLDAWHKSLNQALKKYNHLQISKQKFIDVYWGHDLYDNIKNNNLSLEVGLFCNKVYSKYLDDVKIYPYTRSVLEKLSNYRKTVLTNTPSDCTIQILKKFDIEKFFDFVLTSDDVSMGKPDPELVIKTCEKLDIKPQNAVLVGDTDSDVKAGKAAGCKVIGVNIDADFRVKNISELPNVLEI